MMSGAAEMQLYYFKGKQMNFLITVIQEMPEGLRSMEELMAFDIYTAKRLGIKSFVRPVVPLLDIHPQLDDRSKEIIRQSKFCEIKFIEVDGRQVRTQTFLKDIQILSTLN